jgi:hypothetical protein
MNKVNFKEGIMIFERKRIFVNSKKCRDLENLGIFPLLRTFVQKNSDVEM